jgi:hypothetical protein
MQSRKYRTRAEKDVRDSRRRRAGKLLSDVEYLLLKKEGGSPVVSSEMPLKNNVMKRDQNTLDAFYLLCILNKSWDNIKNVFSLPPFSSFLHLAPGAATAPDCDTVMGTAPEA